MLVMEGKSQDDRSYRGLQRSRIVAAALCLLTIAIGLLSRSRFNPFPPFLGKYPGDALWAIMAYWTVTFFAPARSVGFRSAIALSISILDELSQALHPVWLDHIRSTMIGHLVLGTDFSAKDIAAYAAGIALVALIDRIVISRKPNKSGAI
jgi:hypothetical protein